MFVKFFSEIWICNFGSARYFDTNITDSALNMTFVFWMKHLKAFVTTCRCLHCAKGFPYRDYYLLNQFCCGYLWWEIWDFDLINIYKYQYLSLVFKKFILLIDFCIFKWMMVV